MAKQNYIFYEKTNPFPGWLRMVGQVDPDQLPDGSTLGERLEQLKIKYSDAVYKLFPLGELPNPEEVKFDIVSETFVPIEPGDITPKAQEILEQNQKHQDIIDNLPSRALVKNAITAAFSDISQRNIMLKLADVVYWLAKNKKE